MTGSERDMLARLKAVLPARWFPDVAPVLNGLLAGIASAWAWSYSQLAYVKLQTRVATATDVWLDVIAQDFFGSRLTRQGRTDGAFRSSLQLELLRERGTRAAVIWVPRNSCNWFGIRVRRRLGQHRSAVPMLHHSL
jgi:hypothetical protein